MNLFSGPFIKFLIHSKLYNENIIFLFRWAVEGNFIFGEWLIGSCQHILIQEYVRLLNSWCEWNKYSRKLSLKLTSYYME